jgi:hypothetical protein
MNENKTLLNKQLLKELDSVKKEIESSNKAGDLKLVSLIDHRDEIQLNKIFLLYFIKKNHFYFIFLI